ncbi:MAG: hypothetical protein LBR86_01550 [Tannerella sp.]|jgi:hypothetical protein|nr:hypothetical protein [Tannerella sp.]
MMKAKNRMQHFLTVCLLFGLVNVANIAAANGAGVHGIQSVQQQPAGSGISLIQSGKSAGNKL